MIEDILGIGIVGAFLSLVIQYLKNKFGTDSLKTKAMTVVLAVLVGTVYVLFRATEWWATVLSVLAAASTVYAFFLKK